MERLLVDAAIFSGGGLTYEYLKNLPMSELSRVIGRVMYHHNQGGS